MGQFSKPWNELTFADNYIFCKVMLDEELCKKFIEILLGIKIAKIEYLNVLFLKPVSIDLYKPAINPYTSDTIKNP